jgi:hypothetical protein
MIFEKPYNQYEGKLLETPNAEEYYFVVKYLPTLPAWDTRKNVIAFDMICIFPKSKTIEKRMITPLVGYKGAFLSGVRPSKNPPDSIKQWVIKEIWDLNE